MSARVAVMRQRLGTVWRQNMMARHRMIYSALGDMMKREIHVLNV